jgi:hypothetical protein
MSAPVLAVLLLRPVAPTSRARVAATSMHGPFILFDQVRVRVFGLLARVLSVAPAILVGRAAACFTSVSSGLEMLK